MAGKQRQDLGDAWRRRGDRTLVMRGGNGDITSVMRGGTWKLTVVEETSVSVAGRVDTQEALQNALRRHYEAWRDELRGC